MMQHELRKRIFQKLKAHSELNVERVKINITQNFVELSGEVDGENALATVEGIVRSIEGVSEVVNLMSVHKGSTSGVQGINLT